MKTSQNLETSRSKSISSARCANQNRSTVRQKSGNSRKTPDGSLRRLDIGKKAAAYYDKAVKSKSPLGLSIADNSIFSSKMMESVNHSHFGEDSANATMISKNYFSIQLPPQQMNTSALEETVSLIVAEKQPKTHVKPQNEVHLTEELNSLMTVYQVKRFIQDYRITVEDLIDYLFPLLGAKKLKTPQMLTRLLVDSCLNPTKCNRNCSVKRIRQEHPSFMRGLLESYAKWLMQYHFGKIV